MHTISNGNKLRKTKLVFSLANEAIKKDIRSFLSREATSKWNEFTLDVLKVDNNNIIFHHSFVVLGVWFS